MKAKSYVPSEETRLTIAKREEAVALVCEHNFPWCRARLLHALAGAVEQGIFDDVMGELIGHDDSEDIIRDARNMLRGWMLKGGGT